MGKTPDSNITSLHELRQVVLKLFIFDKIQMR